jgi:hypothetical protein
MLAYCDNFEPGTAEEGWMLFVIIAVIFGGIMLQEWLDERNKP